MSHEFETGFFVNDPAWHGLGKLVREAPSVEDAIVMAGLDWSVELRPLFLATGNSPVALPTEVTHRATVRSTDDSVLGVVGPGYKPLQNREAFKFFEPFVANGEVKLEAAGSLRKGRRVWVLGKIAGATLDVKPGDAVEKYVLLSNSHDGTSAVRVGFTDVRVVCMNTLRMAHRDKASKLIKVRHTSNVTTALDEVREVMNLARQGFEADVAKYRRLAEVGCDEETLRRYVRVVFGDESKADDENASKRVVAQVFPLFEDGRGAELCRGTLWGAFNAVTEYVTHERGRSADTRVEATWYGTGADLTARALDTALDFANAA